MGETNRRAKRIDTSIDVNWGFKKDCPYSGTIINMTVLGCALQDKDDVDVHPGQIVLIRFWMPRKQILKVVVVHKSLQGGVKGFGAQFVELTAEQKETLEQLIDLFAEPERAEQT